MNPRRKKRLYTLLALLFGFGGAIGLTLYSLTQNIDWFYTPSEIVQGKDGRMPVIGQRVNVGGMVVPGSVKRDEDSLKVMFKLTDTGPEITVKYDGILPDLFREGQGIVAQGVLADGNVVEATEVLAKHDEEYMPPELAEKMKGIKHVKPQYNNAGS